MKRLVAILKRTVSAALVASLVSGTYSSLAFADQPGVTTERSCRLVAMDDYIAQHAANLGADVAPTGPRGLTERLRTSALTSILKLRKPKRVWSETRYLQHYVEIRQALDAGKTVDISTYQTPEALLAVFDVTSERARAESGLFKGDFSFGAMMRNANDLQRARLLKNLGKVTDAKGYKSWQAGDALVDLYLMTKDPTDSLGFLRSRGESRALREMIQNRLESQILRRELGSVLAEIGLGRANEPTKDFLIKGYLRARKFASSIMWTTAIIASSGQLGIMLHSATATGMKGTALASTVPIGDLTRTRKPLTPEMEKRLKQAQDMDDLWSAIPLQDKATAAIQVHANIVQYTAIRIMAMVYLIILLQQEWQWRKPEIREHFPKAVDKFSTTVAQVSGTDSGVSQAKLEADVYQQWHDQHSLMNPNIDNTPAAQDIRDQIHQESRALLTDIVAGNQTLSDAGIEEKVSPEKAAADMQDYSVDKKADGTDDSRYAGLPPISE